MRSCMRIAPGGGLAFGPLYEAGRLGHATVHAKFLSRAESVPHCYNTEAPQTPRSKPMTFRTRILIIVLCVLSVFSPLSAVNSAPPFYSDKNKLLVYRDADGTEHPIKTPEDWAKRRAHILANMQEVMGPLPEVSR